MIRRVDYGPVQYFAMARSLAGRYLLSSGVYVVDGLLIDTGPANAGRQLDKVLDGLAIEQIVLTHHHEDHAGNAKRAAERLGLTPRMHALGVPMVETPQPLPLYRRVVWGTPPSVRAEALGEEVRTSAYRFDVLHTPGHAADHVVLHEPRQRWLFAGDLFLAERLKVLRADEDAGALMDSLRSLLRLPDSLLFCQHSGAHRTHQHRIARKLDFLLGTQSRARMLHEEGHSVRQIARELRLERPFWRFVSRGEFSGENLVRSLLRAADVDV